MDKTFRYRIDRHAEIVRVIFSIEFAAKENSIGRKSAKKCYNIMVLSYFLKRPNILVYSY